MISNKCLECTLARVACIGESSDGSGHVIINIFTVIALVTNVYSFSYIQDVHPGQLAVSRFVGIFLLTIPMIVYYDLNPFGPPALRHLLILRGVAGATSLLLRFFAFHYLPIADASVIIFSIPVFVSIFAWLFLKVCSTLCDA